MVSLLLDIEESDELFIMEELLTELVPNNFELISRLVLELALLREEVLRVEGIRDGTVDCDVLSSVVVGNFPYFCLHLAAIESAFMLVVVDDVLSEFGRAESMEEMFDWLSEDVLFGKLVERGFLFCMYMDILLVEGRLLYEAVGRYGLEAEILNLIGFSEVGMVELEKIELLRGLENCSSLAGRVK